MSVDEIRLAVPAMPAYARIARLTVAGLATRVAFSYDDVEDLRIAVGEACSLLLGDHGREGNVALTFSVGADETSVEATGTFTDVLATDAATVDLSNQILASVVDEHRLADDLSRIWLRKRRTTG